MIAAHLGVESMVPNIIDPTPIRSAALVKISLTVPSVNHAPTHRPRACPVFSVKGEEVVVGFVVDGASDKTLGFEVLRKLTSELWNDWNEIRLHLARPQPGFDGPNNASERSICRRKVRYKSMRGYKSVRGMTKWHRSNSVALVAGKRA